METDPSPDSARAAWAAQVRAELIVRLRSVCPDLTQVEFEELIDGMVRVRLGDFGREQRNALRLAYAPRPFPRLLSTLPRVEVRKRVALMVAELAPQMRAARPGIREGELLAMLTDMALMRLANEARVRRSPPRIPPASRRSTGEHGAAAALA